MDLTRALQLLLRQLGDRKINIFSFDPTIPPFCSVAEATWTELRDMNYVHSALNSSGYCLTGSGWLRALQRAGATRNRDFDRDSEKLLASINKLAKRARLATLKALAQDSGLPENWIYNAIESNLLEVHYGRKGANWARGFEGTMIYVPRGFGTKL